MGKVSTRVAGIAGIIFILLIALPGFASGAPPDTDKPATEFLKYVQENRSGILVGTFFSGLADVFVVFFIGGLVMALRRLGAAPLLLIASVVALVLTGAVATVGGLLQVGAAYRLNGAQHVDAETIRLVYDASTAAFVLISFSLAAFLLVNGMMMASVRLFPTWLAWLGMVGAAVELVGTPSLFGTSGFYSLEGAVGIIGLTPFALFTLGTGIVMVIRGPAMDAAAG
jgi:Domain of unknown function (DUF4386)